MTVEKGPSEAFYVAVAALASVLSTPFQKGLNTAQVGDWLLTINNGMEPQPMNDETIGSFEVRATNTRYFAVAILDPGGGIIGGMTENQFIADLSQFAPAP